MKIYILHIFIVTVIYLTSKIKKKNLSLIYILYSVFVFGQRWGSGTDFVNYLNYYLVNFKREFIYTMLQNIIVKNDLYFGLLIFIIYTLTIVLFTNIINKTLKYSNEIMYIFFLSEIHLMITSQIRNWTAIAFYLNAYYYYKIKNKKLIPIFLIILGYGFHKSILYVIPFLFIKLKLNKKKKLIILCLIFVFSIFNFNIVLNYFSFHYSSYLTSRFNNSLSIISKMKFYLLLIIYIYYYCFNKKNIYTKKDRMIEEGAYIYMVAYAIALNSGMVNRISYYFKIFEIFYIVIFFDKLKIRRIKFLPFLYFYCYLIGILITDVSDFKSYEFRRMRIYRNESKQEYRKYINEWYYNKKK